MASTAVPMQTMETTTAPAQESARRTLDAVVARSAIVFRCGFCIVAPISALAIGGPAGVDLWRVPVLLAVLAWGGVVAAVCRRQRRLPRWLVLADAALFAAIVANGRLLVPADLVTDGSTRVAASLSSSIFLVSWALAWWQAALVVAGEIGAFLAGAVWAGLPLDRVVIFTAVVYPIQLLLGLLVIRLMRRTAAATDEALRRLDEQRRAQAVDEARLRDADEQRLRLHDTVLSTLTAVARGGFNGRTDLVQRRARMDLAQLASTAVAAVGDGDALLPWLRREAEVRGITLAYRGPASVPLPRPVVDAIGSCLREGLSNVERHSGVDRAELTITTSGGGLIATLADTGSGFSPGPQRRHTLGLRDSIIGRMEAVGGHARVASRLGSGTTVTLSWRPSVPVPVTEGPFASLLNRANATGFARTLTVVAFCWHLTTAVQLIGHLGDYRWPHADVAAWLVFAGVGVWLLRQAPGQPVSRRAGWTVLGLLVLAATVAFLACEPVGLDDKANWAIGEVGWFLVAVAGHRPAAEIAVAWPLVLIIDLVAVAAQFPGQPRPVGHTASILLVVSFVQVGALAMYRILRNNGHVAAQALRTVHQLQTTYAALQAVSADRAARYRNLEATLLPLVRGLSDGTVDPTHPPTHDRAWVAAGMLRALLEHDVDHSSAATTDAVVAIAAAAGQNGAAPEVRVDDLGHLPADAVTSLVRAATTVLSHASPGDATVVLRHGTSEATTTVCMSTTAHPDLLRRLAAGSSTIALLQIDAMQVDDHRVWLEARWAG